MVRGYIDSASIVGVIAALTYDRPEKWPEWTAQSATATTSILTNDRQFEIAPTPGAYTGARGLFDVAMHGLSMFVSEARPSARSHGRAHRRVVAWANANAARLRGIYTETKADPSFEPWLEWAVTQQWVDHSQMLGGLFNREYIPALSRVLGLTKADLKRLWSATTNPKQVDRWASTFPADGDGEAVASAFVVSALMRGRHHDALAELSRRQIMHHPFRDKVLRTRKDSAQFKLTNTEAHFASIMLASAMVEREPAARVALWAENLAKTRKAHEAIDLREKTSDSTAMECALRAVKTARLRTFPRDTAVAVDTILSIISGAAVCVLCGWLSRPLVGVLGQSLIDLTGTEVLRPSPGLRIAEAVSNVPPRLRRLASAVPGRVAFRKTP